MNTVLSSSSIPPRSSTPTIVRGSLGKEWPHAKPVSTPVRDILQDGGIFIDIQWNYTTNTLSPTTNQIREYFKYHKETPVHIRFIQQTQAKFSSSFSQDELEKYFDVLLEVLPRWKSLRLWAPYVPRQSFVGKIFPEARLLEEVLIEGPSSFDIPVTCQLLSSCWNGSHSLRAFEVISTVDNSVGSMVINPRIYLPLKNVTRIQLCNKLSILECSEVIFHAPNLVECLFRNVTGSASVLSSIRCKNLEKLILAANPEDFRLGKPINLNMLFDTFRAPVLKHLELSLITHWDQEYLSFISFLQRSRCGLQALELHWIEITEHQLRSMLLMLPSLRVLEVHNTPRRSPQPLSPRPMENLTKPGRNPSTLCPQLEMISINDTVVLSLADNMLLNLLSGHNMKICRFIPDGHPTQQNREVTKIIENVKSQLGITVLDQDTPASTKTWDDHRNIVVSSKSKNPDLSSLLGLILTGPSQAP